MTTTTPKTTILTPDDHRAAEPMLAFFRWQQLPPQLQTFSRPWGELADWVVCNVPRSAERTVALRKLLEGKDAGVRAAMAAAPAHAPAPPLVRELLAGERATWGACAVCGAGHGKVCEAIGQVVEVTEDGAVRAHAERLEAAPPHVMLVPTSFPLA